MHRLWPLQVFDSSEDFAVVERKLPHWSQAGTVCFITWRTNDSIPPQVLRRWHADRDAWLKRNGIDPKRPDWKSEFDVLAVDVRRAFAKTFSERWHRQLDACHGACVLRRSDVARVVEESLLKFDGDRYLVTDFVIMPNHVHLLASFADESWMLKQCEGWKHYQARKINRLIGSRGRFWQQDGFDHLVRSIEQFEAIQRYIVSNPFKAGIKEGQYRHYTK